MSREWQPGDVAMVAGLVAFKADGEGWHVPGYAVPQTYFYTEPRPLVVIDPEDADRFVTLVADRTEDLLALDEEDRGYVMEGTTNALREFADPKPPKPEEPQGLGAVVRDANNEPWIRTCNPCDDCLNKPWQRGPVHKNWYIVDAVEVLSEGYDQGADEPLADWERDLLRGQS